MKLTMSILEQGLHFPMGTQEQEVVAVQSGTIPIEVGQRDKVTLSQQSIQPQHPISLKPPQVRVKLLILKTHFLGCRTSPHTVHVHVRWQQVQQRPRCCWSLRSCWLVILPLSSCASAGLPHSRSKTATHCTRKLR